MVVFLAKALNKDYIIFLFNLMNLISIFLNDSFYYKPN